MRATCAARSRYCFSFSTAELFIREIREKKKAHCKNIFKMETKSVKIPNILRAKVSVIGESQVGKSALCQQLTSDGTNFPKNYLMTVLMEVAVKSIQIPDTNDVVELYLCDCSGRDIYGDILMEEGWKGTAMIVAMYDVCREESFGSVAKWVERVALSVKKDKENSDNDDPKESRLNGVLVANKTDLATRRVVSPKVGSDLAQQLGLMYFETSCKDYNGVEDPFYYLANEFHKMHEEKTAMMTGLAQ